jgi:tripartite-type tricarboxylate transporter receptor subunit TctC
MDHQNSFPKNLAITRRCLAALLLSGAATLAGAQDNGRPIRLIVITPPGGIVDTSARLLAERWGAKTGRTVIVENRAGASGNIAAEFVARAPKDGSVLLYTSNSFTTNAYLYRRLSFDSRNDFVPVLQVAEFSLVIAANSATKIRTMAELISQSKAQPNSLNYGTGGNGQPGHVATELVKSQTHIEMQHVPYKGAGPAMADAMSGQIQLGVGSLGSALPFIKSGQLNGLAVTGKARAASAPQIPTLAEAGLAGYDYTGWIGIMAPKGTPAATLKAAQAQIAEVLAMPEVEQKIEAQGGLVVHESTEQFQRMLNRDFDRNEKLVREGAIKMEDN